MRKKRILHNELNEEIYESTTWNKKKIFLLGFTLLLFGFIINLSLMDKIQTFLNLALTKNPDCPMSFNKLDYSIFPPKLIINKLSIQGTCFGHPSNQLLIDDIKIGPDFPSISRLGMRFNIQIKAQDSILNLSPIISFKKLFIEIDKSSINANIIRVLTEDNKSPIAGKLSIMGFIEFSNQNLNDANITIESNNFFFPSQRLSGFDLPIINLNKFNLKAYVKDQGQLKIESIEIGKENGPVEIRLHGDMLINQNQFMTSTLNLNGSLKLSANFISNFSFINLMLPQGHPDGKYQMRIQGPLQSPGAPQFY
jgi:hypothetical protein